MSQEESHQPLTMGSRVHSVVGSCGIYGEQGCTTADFSSSISGFFGQYHFTGVPCAFIRTLPKLNNRSSC
jgi:hypothetical protein